MACPESRPDSQPCTASAPLNHPNIMQCLEHACAAQRRHRLPIDPIPLHQPPSRVLLLITMSSETHIFDCPRLPASKGDIGARYTGMRGIWGDVTCSSTQRRSPWPRQQWATVGCHDHALGHHRHAITNLLPEGAAPARSSRTGRHVRTRRKRSGALWVKKSRTK